MLVKNQQLRMEAGQESAAPAVEIDRLTKKFGADFHALDDVSLSIRKGEFFSLLGPSGCGKTTLLRIIGGFEAPTRGDVRIDGRSVIHEPPNQRVTNMIFQHLALFPHMSVAENVAFGLKMRKVADAEAKSRVQEALAMVRLEGFGDRPVDQLSGGQRQRVAIARALVNEPSVLLLDEPLGALDLQLRIQMHSELRRLHKEIGNTFIFVTHDQGEALTLSDRVAVMNDAKIVQIGTPEEIYERPETRFVASFVGHTNLLDGRVAGRHGKTGQMVETDNGLRIAVDSTAELSAGQPVSLGIRYEKVRLARRKAAKDSSVSLSGTVRERTYLGSQIRFLVAIEGSGEAQIVADLPADGDGRDIGEGDKVTASWQRGAANVFTE